MKPGRSVALLEAALLRERRASPHLWSAGISTVEQHEHPRTNWKVAWHQDLTIAVQRRIDVAGFGPWSEKAGVASVQPPLPVLQNMLSLRLHLDACGADNAPLLVLPGSHARGRLTPAQIDRWRDRVPAVAAVAARGSCLVLRPLLLHASSAATRPGRRRVVHLDFATAALPGGLEWHTRV